MIFSCFIHKPGGAHRCLWGAFGLLVAMGLASACSKKDEPRDTSKKKKRTPRTSRSKVKDKADKADEGKESQHPEDTDPSRQGPSRATRRGRPQARVLHGKIPPRATKTGNNKKKVAIYDLLLGKHKMGRLVAREEHAGGMITTVADARFTIKRAGMSIKLRALEVFKEKVGGEPVSFRVLMDQSISKMEAKGVFKNGAMKVTDSTGTRKLPYKKEWLFPYAANELAKAKGFKPGTKFSYMKYGPQMGYKGIRVTHEVLGKGSATFRGKKMPCHRVKISSPALPSQVVCVDKDYVAYEMSFQMGGMALQMKLVKRTP